MNFKYEYKLLTIPRGDIEAFGEQLNQMGAQGWHVVAVFQQGNDNKALIERAYEPPSRFVGDLPAFAAFHDPA